MMIDIYGDALRLLEHFIYYAKTNRECMAAAMYYDRDAFGRRILLLETLFIKAKNESM